MKEKRKFYMKSKDGSITYTTDGKFLYAETGGDTIRLALFDKHYYKLRIENDVPILEVDGVRMHLVKDFTTPLEYSKQVVKGLGISKSALSAKKDGEAILDTCMGLGYTAIEASRKKPVETVVTCELSEAVFSLAKWNPLSQPLWEEDGKILPMLGDVSKLVLEFDSSMFGYIIHDPPRFSHAPDLYSIVFYKELCRVCKKDARIFHYVGSVGKTKGRNIKEEVMKRLREAGFKQLKYSKKLQGIFASK